MKAFIASLVVLVVVAAAAGYGLQWLDMSAQRTYSAPGSVRL